MEIAPGTLALSYCCYVRCRPNSGLLSDAPSLSSLAQGEVASDPRSGCLRKVGPALSCSCTTARRRSQERGDEAFALRGRSSNAEATCIKARSRSVSGNQQCHRVANAIGRESIENKGPFLPRARPPAVRFHVPEGPLRKGFAPGRNAAGLPAHPSNSSEWNGQALLVYPAHQLLRVAIYAQRE